MDVKCPICGGYYKVYPTCIYPGDQSACQECIRKEKEKKKEKK